MISFSEVGKANEVAEKWVKDTIGLTEAITDDEARHIGLKLVNHLVNTKGVIEIKKLDSHYEFYNEELKLALDFLEDVRVFLRLSASVKRWAKSGQTIIKPDCEKEAKVLVLAMRLNGICKTANEFELLVNSEDGEQQIRQAYADFQSIAT